MGLSSDYPNVPEWASKPEGYQTDSMVKYEGNVFKAAFWASKPGEGDPDRNGWRLYDELYDLTSHPSTEPAKIIAYIPTWRKKEGFNYANQEMYRNITHGIISFLMFSEANLGEFEPAAINDVNAIIEDVVLTGHECGTRISIALGGATDYGFLYLMEIIGNNPSDPLLNQAVQKVVDFVESNGLDGIDLDLECWWDKNGNAGNDQGGRKKSDGAHPAGRGLTEFAKQLKQAMPDKLVSAALFATSWYGNNYDPKLIDYLDWVGIMTYDLTGSWNNSPVGPQTALLKIRKQEDYKGEQHGSWPASRPSSPSQDPTEDNPILSVEDSLWYWSNPFFNNWQGTGQKIPRNKIAAGVPIYGYDFAYGKEPDDLSGQIPPGYKVIRYKDILSQFSNAHTATNANIKVSGSTARPPFVSASGLYPYVHNIYFETPDTAITKLNFLKSVGAQGAIIWELSNEVWEEGKSIIKALYKNSGNPETRPALSSKLLPSLASNLIGTIPPDKFEDTKLPFGTSGTPAVAVYDGKLFCVHEGQGEDGWLWYVTFDGNNWSDDTKLPFGTSGPPALAVYDGKLFCVHEGREEEGWLWYTTFDGRDWSDDVKLPFGVGSRRHGIPSAALAVYNGLLYCVHEGRGEDGWLWCTTFDGQNWSDDTKLPQHGTSSAPALAAIDNRLICLHEGQDEEGWLWHTYFDGKDWSEDRLFVVHTFGSPPLTGIGISGPPGVTVHDGKLYCIHEGQGEDGWLWSFEEQTWKDTKLPFGTSRPPGLAAFNGKLYCLHEGQGEDGWIWCATLASLPTSDAQWIEARGSNSYCYYQLDNHITDGQRIAISKTIRVDAGAPYLYAVLIKNDDLVDFPIGAILTIKGPDGTVYHKQTNEEKLLVIMSDSSLRSLVVKDPMPGDWIITLTVPEGVEFHFEFQTLPSQDVSETINNFLRSSHSKHPGNLRLQKRDLGSVEAAIPVISWLGMAAIGLIATAVAPVLGAGVAMASLVNAATAGTIDLWSIHPGPSTRTDLLNLEPIRLRDSSRNITDILNRNRQRTARVRIATWNVYHGNINGRTPQQRMRDQAVFGYERGVHIISFQEVPIGFFDNPNAAITAITNGTPYAAAIMETEYPNNGRAAASRTSDGYLILYNPRVITPQLPMNFFQPDRFIQGIAQARPPVGFQFTINGTDTNVQFLTWHAEPQRSLARNYVATLYDLLGGNYIVAGDFNVWETDINRIPNNHRLTHYVDSLDHIISNRPVINVINSDPTVTNEMWEQLFSDHHYALFGEIEFPVEEHEDVEEHEEL